jgi:hypothetical protein
MFCIQFMDHEEGSMMRWREVLNTRHETRDATREHLKQIRKQDDEDPYLLYSYRVVEVGSNQYYSQPTDALEY